MKRVDVKDNVWIEVVINVRRNINSYSCTDQQLSDAFSMVSDL